MEIRSRKENGQDMELDGDVLEHGASFFTLLQRLV
jgi:hypothetical protein